MKLDALVTTVLLIRFALSFLWFVVECRQKVSLKSDNSFLLVHKFVCVVSVPVGLPVSKASNVPLSTSTKPIFFCHGVFS
jgi:hypothetical protein